MGLDDQEFVFAGRRPRGRASQPAASQKEGIFRRVVQVAVVGTLLVGTGAATYFFLSDSEGVPDLAGQQPAGGSFQAGAGAHFLQLSPGLGIDQADLAMSRIQAAYQPMLGNLGVSLRAQPVPGGAPQYFVVAGPIYNAITAEDLCGQIEARGQGDPCGIVTQAPDVSPAGNQFAAAPPQAQPQIQAAPPAPNAAPTGLSANPEIVALVQKRLRAIGFQTGNQQGLMDPQTDASIRAYQAALGFEPNGRITTDLLDQLMSQPPVAASARVPAAQAAGGDSSGRVTLPLDAASGPSGGLGAQVPSNQAPATGYTGGQVAQQTRQGVAAVPSQLPANPLTSRAQEFLTIGDFSSARLLYEQAFQQGDPTAASGMAKTYDPVYYLETGVVGMNPNPEIAVDWYRKAIDAGDGDARARLDQLISWLQRRSAATSGDSTRILEALQ